MGEEGGLRASRGWAAACRLRLRDRSTLERQPCAGRWWEDSGGLPSRPMSRNQLEEPLLLAPPRTPPRAQGPWPPVQASGPLFSL